MSNYIDRVLNRFSMYTVVSISLLILFAAAIVMSLLGQLAYSPLEMIASAIVLLGTVYLSSLLCGLLFGVKIHAESSFITGMILALIFTPTLELAELATLAAVGVFAGASKFLLAWKGRHIFNPVAAGAFIASVLGVAFASWWVATPPLFIFILIPAFMILYKTRRLLMGGIFLLVATIILLIVFTGYGLEPLESAELLLSWPLLFFAGFMLSEPLTMPAKKSQQIVEAILVGILFAVPLSIGSIEMTPILALLIGNLYAFLVSHRHSIQLEFQKMEQLTSTSYELVFKPLTPLTYEAGQYMELTLHHLGKDFRGIRRVFSITSAPGDETIRFGVKFYEPSSTFKKALRNLKKGDRLSATSVNGDFVLPKNIKTPLLFIAGGIGVTPFIGHIRWLLKQKQRRDVVVVYAVASHAELAYMTLLKAAGVKVIVVANDPGVSSDQVTAVSAPFVSVDLLQKHVPDIARRAAYLSGPPGLITALKPALRSLKVASLKTDYFTGY